MNSTQLHSFSCGKVYLWLSAFALGGMVLTAHYQLNTVDGTNFTGTIVPSTLDCAAPGERRSPFVPVPFPRLAHSHFRPSLLREKVPTAGAYFVSRLGRAVSSRE